MHSSNARQNGVQKMARLYMQFQCTTKGGPKTSFGQFDLALLKIPYVNTGIFYAQGMRFLDILA